RPPRAVRHEATIACAPAPRHRLHPSRAKCTVAGGTFRPSKRCSQCFELRTPGAPLMQSNRTCAYRACQIFDLDAIRTFRREVFAADPAIPQPPCPELISDLWDQSAAHLALLCRDEIVGVIRFARPVNGKLPLHEHV